MRPDAFMDLTPPPLIRACRYCEAVYQARRSWQRYCTPGCRQQAWLIRRDASLIADALRHERPRKREEPPS